MKFFVLSDKPDVYLGMRLAGMDGAVVRTATRLWTDPGDRRRKGGRDPAHHR